MARIQVQFNGRGRAYTFECSKPVKLGDTVSVWTDVMGHTTGEVVALESDYDGPVKQVLSVHQEEQ